MKTLYDKIWEQHQVCDKPDGTSIIYIDRHLIHEVTSPQAFEGIKLTGRKIRRPDTIMAVSDHNVPTLNHRMGITDLESRLQIGMLQQNRSKYRINYIEILDKRQDCPYYWAGTRLYIAWYYYRLR